MPSDDSPEHRTERVFSHAAALARARAEEAGRASTLLVAFVKDALEAGIAPTPLKVRTYNGATRYRTGLRGWYLRKDGSVGVGEDGKFYVLSAPSSLAGRVSGVTLAPSDPPMELGRGARDGESMPLPTALERRLAAGSHFPS